MPQRWNDSAQIRREQIESGVDLTFNEVFKPFFVDQISKLSPKKVLEVGAGTGHLSKALFEAGLLVTAIEPSDGMIKIAEEVLSSTQVKLVKCTSFELEKSAKFETVFSHLVAHVVKDLSSFFESIRNHLEKNGYFIFSIPHPCFYNAHKSFFGEEYNYMLQLSKSVSFNISMDKEKIISGVPYHHRPLSFYINHLVEAGFSIERFDETYPAKEIQDKYDKQWKYPRYCVFTCKNA